MGCPLQMVSETDPSFPERHRDLASLEYPVPYALVQTPERLEIRECGPGGARLCVDFLTGRLGYRRQHGGGAGQAVARAVMSRSKEPPRVIDATAGMGRDAFVLASLGCRVTMFERNPVVRLLLEDGLRRAYGDPELRERLILSPLNSILDLPREQCCDVVYLDPMFPERRSSALVKKDMRIFHHLAGADADAGELLPRALELAARRVAVKRPRGAPYLGDVPTADSIVTPGCRFDLYFPGKLYLPGEPGSKGP